MTISVIIPTLNEEGCLEDTLTLLRQHRPHEIIVVDGGSTDRTCALAAAADRLLQGPPGRAAQLNNGAAPASGDILLFMHADCSLEDGALDEAERLAQKRRVVAGCFAMTVRSRSFWFRPINACATARVRLTGIIYGDQGLFVRRDIFHRLGGFPNVRFMEDIFFSRELRRHGRIVVAKRRIFVSPRRWQQVGIVRQTIRNWTLTILAAAGMHPDKLEAFYPPIR
jgi:rSAM/selenodomain-associated transferase 2